MTAAPALARATSPGTEWSIRGGSTALRIALIVLGEPDAVGALPRNLLTVAGRSVAQHQLDLALGLQCRRVAALSRTTMPEVTALKARVEEAGAQFHLIGDAVSLASLIGAGDDLVVFAEGLLADPEAADALLDPGPAVLALPVENALPLGFERLDLNRAVAGLSRIPGRVAERIVDLPADYDVASALTRLALQAGVPVRDIAEAPSRSGAWRMVRSEAEAHALDGEWIALSLGDGRGATPSERAARIAVGAAGAALLHGGNASRMLHGGAAVLLLLALCAGWLHAPTIGFVALAAACLIGQAALLMQRVERGTRAGGADRALAAGLFWLIDACLVVLAAGSGGPDGATGGAARLFAPLMLVALLHLAPFVFARRHARWIEDRAVIAALLAFATGMGLLTAAVQLLALAIGAGAVLYLSFGAGAPLSRRG